MVWNFYIFIYTAILDTRYWYLVQYSIFPNCPYSEAFWIRIHFRITDLVPAVPVPYLSKPSFFKQISKNRVWFVQFCLNPNPLQCFSPPKFVCIVFPRSFLPWKLKKFSTITRKMVPVLVCKDKIYFIPTKFQRGGGGEVVGRGGGSDLVSQVGCIRIKIVHTSSYHYTVFSLNEPPT